MHGCIFGEKVVTNTSNTVRVVLAELLELVEGSTSTTNSSTSRPSTGSTSSTSSTICIRISSGSDTKPGFSHPKTGALGVLHAEKAMNTMRTAVQQQSPCPRETVTGSELPLLGL